MGWGGTEIRRMVFDHDRAGAGVNALFVDPWPAAFDSAVDASKSLLDKFTDGMPFPGRQNIIVRVVLLNDHPHSFNVIPRVPPVAHCIQIAGIQSLLQSEIYGGSGPGEFPAHQGVAPHRAFMAEH